VLSVRAPRRADRKKVQLGGSPDEAAQALVDHLSQEGVL